MLVKADAPRIGAAAAILAGSLMASPILLAPLAVGRIRKASPETGMRMAQPIRASNARRYSL